jgi:hypothetical protein
LAASGYCKAGFISHRDASRKWGRNQRWGNELERAHRQLFKEKRIRQAECSPSGMGKPVLGYEWIGDDVEE